MLIVWQRWFMKLGIKYFFIKKLAPQNREVRVRQGFSLTQSKYQMRAHLNSRVCHLSMYQFDSFFRIICSSEISLKSLYVSKIIWRCILISEKQNWAKKSQIVALISQNLPKRYIIRWPILYLNSNTK